MRIRNALKQCSVNISLLVLTTVICFWVSEGVSRLLLDPGDYLAPQLLPDEILKWRIEPHSAGHDAWGFRNRSVPDTADIVVVGDSQTYGINASAQNSWPMILGRLMNKNVYNMALGGFCPVQYYYLIITSAIQLNPSFVIVGFYFGNDLSGTYHMIHEYPYWNYLSKTNQLKSEITSSYIQDRKLVEDKLPFHLKLRKWLSQNSIIYRLFTYNLAENFRHLETKYFHSADEAIVFLDDNENNIHTAFKPEIRYNAMNLEDVTIREGLEVSLELFAEMNAFCKENGIDFVVVLIPTKESVFSRYIEDKILLPHSDLLNQVMKNERKIKEIISDYFTSNYIRYIDVLQPLRNSIPAVKCYPSNWDGHPNKYGYEIIASTVKQYLESIE